ncbi:MAG TPA: NAD(P)/FAD-dependent oxidoreductase [Thermomicrobiales bacterium]|nr:NAD(P)/FAD-dependent oxidoreductase [Thermomicrobiales bacterium]
MPLDTSPQPVPSVNTRRHIVDAAIIGGGIAGGALAIVLRRAGLDVALIEREPRFRDRIRGEAVHPWGVREANALGLRPLLDAAGAIELPCWTRYRDAVAGEPYAWRDDFPDSPGELSVGHPVLQETLLTAARDEGARVWRPATATPARTADGWEIAIASDEEAATLATPLLIGADGQRSSVRRLIGGAATRDPIHHAMGGVLARGVDLPRDSAHQAYHPAGFGMVFPQRDDLSRVYYVCSTDESRALQMSGPDAFLTRVAALYPEGAFARATPAGPMGFFPNADLVSDRVAAPGAVLIGDAASANDPSQGHGLSLVFRDVRVLGDLLTGDTPLAEVPDRFEEKRASYYGVVREHARWAAPLVAEDSARADALRAQVERAREADPSAGGFAGIFATGPDGLAVDDRARMHFYGEDLPGATVFDAP